MGMVIYLRRAAVEDLARLRADPSKWEAFAFDEAADDDIVDFDKAWHALHFMMTGTDGNSAEPLGIIASDGETLGTDENGFGGFTPISPAAMAAFDAALRGIDDATLAARYDPAAMVERDLYIADVFADEGAEALDYVMQGVPALRRLAARCAAHGDGALRIMS